MQRTVVLAGENHQQLYCAKECLCFHKFLVDLTLAADKKLIAVPSL